MNPNLKPQTGRDGALAPARSMIRIEGHTFILENAHVRRQLAYDTSGLTTVSLVHKATGREFAREAPAAEFMLRLNNRMVFGHRAGGVHVLDGSNIEADCGCELVSARAVSAGPGVEQLRVELRVKGLEATITACYEIHEAHAGLAKWLEVTSGLDDLLVNAVNFEILNACPGPFVDVECYRQGGLARLEICSSHSGNEDLLQFHNPLLGEGMFLGNSAPGLLRSFLVYPHWQDTAICAGYNAQSPAYNRYLRRGETLVTHRALLFLYQGRADSNAVRNRWRDYLRTFLPPLTEDGGITFCTWVPLLTKINEEIVLAMAERAAEAGARRFLVDDGGRLV